MADDSDPPQDLTGRRLGDYEVLRKLGQGAMGQVYLARQLSLKREVALKVLRRDHAANPTALLRFQAEAEAVAQLTHPNIVQVFAVGESDGLRYIALEYVEGRNLREYLARKGSPELPLALSILRQVAAALQRASEAGLVHRDIKPENIMITRKAEVKVADFGLSRYAAGAVGEPLNLTQSGMTLGTPLYMSPEQVQGHAVDHRSDLYSFGVTAYHLLAGQPPFSGATAFDVALRHVQGTPPPLADFRPDLPAALADAVHKLLAKKPADRYQTAREFARDLAAIAKGLPVAVAVAPAPAGSGEVPAASLAVTTAYPAVSAVHPPRLRRWAGRAAGGVALVALVAVGWRLPGRAAPDAAPVSVGLPETRPPSPVATARERELTARVTSRATKPADYLAAAIELGLLYVKEGRPADAERVFKSLGPDGPARTEAALVAHLGQAIVLAARDKAKESNQAVIDAVGRGGASLALLDQVLFKHPDLSQALAEALDRNAANLGVAKLPPALDWLRTPAGVLRGPKA